jgi:hypothetical protein
MASFCPSTLEAKWTTHELIAGAKNEQEVLPFEQVIAEDYVKTIAAIIEKAAWQGDTGSGDANLNKGDGLIKIIDAATNEILANATTYGLAAPIAVATGITKTNVSSIVDAMVLAIPSTIASRDDIKIVCGTDVFRLYVAAIKDANLYHFAVINDGSMELTIPGTNYKLIGVDGLNGTSRLFAFSSANVMYGVDLLNDAEDFEIYHAKEAREMRFTASCNYGFQVAYPDEVVSFKLV